MIPVFYARCVQKNYPEGHVQALRMFLKALESLSVHPMVFDFEYGNSDRTGGSPSATVQRFPFVSCESAISARADLRTAATLLFEAISSLHFGGAERKALQGKQDVIVNLTNCFRYTRLLDPRSQYPLVLHYYMREPSCRILGSWLSDHVDGFLVSSHSLKQYLLQCHLPAQKIKVTYPPVDTSMYRPLDKSKIRQTLGISRDSKVVLYMGSLKEGRFPLETIVQALSETFRELPSVVLVVATPNCPEERERAERLVREGEKWGLSGKILLQVKNLSDKEKNVLYALSDLFIYPASKPSMAIEPPLTVLESMASGTPILACREPSVQEIIDDPKCGEIVDCCQSASLSRVLVALLSDEERLEAFSTSCRRIALAKFSLRVSGTSLLDWYKEILNENHT